MRGWNLVDARGLVAGDGHDDVLQVKLGEGLVLDVDEGLGARDGGPAVDGQRHQALLLRLRSAHNNIFYHALCTAASCNLMSALRSFHDFRKLARNM